MHVYTSTLQFYDVHVCNSTTYTLHEVWWVWFPQFWKFLSLFSSNFPFGPFMVIKKLNCLELAQKFMQIGIDVKCMPHQFWWV